jgi:hypothetical protein
VGREINPVQHRERAEVIVVMMNHVGMATRQQREGAASADDIDRLPEAVEHEDRLVERNVHFGPRH